MPTPWQDKLEEKCRENHFQGPHYQDMSDRRGGRTAWSSTVTFGSIQHQTTVRARYWYDGANINNAREDAAENALKQLTLASPAQGRGAWGL